MHHILGISRSPRFSPNSQDRDAAIFAAVTSRLNRGQNDVSIISEDLFVAVDLSEFDAVYSMARSHNVLQDLCQAEQTGGLVAVNSAQSLLQLSRSNVAEKLTQAQVPLPRYALLHSSDAADAPLPFPFWLKRADFCAQEAGDVCLIHSEAEFQAALGGFRQRDVDELIAEEHLEGDLVKFYGVEGTDFFHTCYPTQAGGFSKFGLESHNLAPKGFAYDEETFRQTADKAAKALGLTVYGGDAVVAADGSFRLIDFNDWPSFSPCRKAAAKAVAQRLNQLINLHEQ